MPLPERAAVISGIPWVFAVSYSPHLKPEPGQPYLQSFADILAYAKKQLS